MKYTSDTNLGVGIGDAPVSGIVGRRLFGLLVCLLVPGFQPPPLALGPRVFVLLALFVADADAVETHRTPHVQAVADVPREVPLLAIERHPAGPEHFEPFFLVEDVLLERLPIEVAPLENLRHEGVELVRRRGRRLCGGLLCEGGRGQAKQAHEHERHIRA
jgi:hypothetical protein